MALKSAGKVHKFTKFWPHTRAHRELSGSSSPAFFLQTPTMDQKFDEATQVRLLPVLVMRAHISTERARDVPRARAGFGTPSVLALLASPMTPVPFQAKVQSSVHQLTGICWKKCVVRPASSNHDRLSLQSRCVTGTPGKNFSSSEQSCLANCVDRFLDSSLFLVKEIEQKRQEAGL